MLQQHAEEAPVALLTAGHAGATVTTRVLIVRLGSMGDIIHTLPAVALLRDALPYASLTWVVEKKWAQLLCSRSALCGARVERGPEKPLVDEVQMVETRAWREHPLASQTRGAVRRLLGDLRAAHYDIAIDFQAAIRSSVMARLGRAPLTAGFSRTLETPASLLYSLRVEAPQRHVVEQNVALAREVLSRVAPQCSVSPGNATAVFDFPFDADDEQWAQRETGGQEFCLMNAAAGWGAKCWPAERLGRVAQELAREGLASIVNFGPGEEATANAVVRASAGAACHLACSVGQLISLARRARLFLGGDTGPLHLAAALGVPVVALYGPTDPERNGPCGPAGFRAIVLRSTESVTDHSRRREPEAGLLRITPAEVMAAARNLLSTPKAHA